MSNYIIITTIHGVTDAVKAWAAFDDWHVVLVGDRKTPLMVRHPHPNVTYLSMAAQVDLGFQCEPLLPLDHYARKNIGYLFAMREGATRIVDTDDDNTPYVAWPISVPSQSEVFAQLVTGAKFFNAYSWFTDEFVWPRGFPLTEIADPSAVNYSRGDTKNVAIFQGLADGDPDVDAIWRLLFPRSFSFHWRQPIVLGMGVYCPFNSQNTLFEKEALPLLYLPISVTFRFTDILRGYIAQRTLWAMGKRLAFCSASVFQDRNEHDLMEDFKDEIPCYTQVEDVVGILDSTPLTGESLLDLTTLYRAVGGAGIVEAKELECLDAWAVDVSKLTKE